MSRDRATERRRSEEHDALRRELERTEAMAVEYRELGLQLVGPLESQVRSLLKRLCRHADWEDSVAPAGEAPAGEHREQRELLESLVADLGFDSRPPVMIAGHVAAVAGLLRKDFGKR